MRRVSRLLVLAAAYFVSGELGLQLAYVNPSTTAVWPPAGIALGALLCFGADLWPGVLLGALLVNLYTSGHTPSSLLIACGNTLEVVAGWWLVTRFAGGVSAFARVRTTFRFALLAGVAAPVVGATTGTLALQWDGLASGAALPVWVTWWLGDGVGVLLLAPLIVMWSQSTHRPWTRRRWIETVVAIAAVSVVAWTSIARPPNALRPYPLPLIALPVLFAFRLSARETALATAVLCVVAVTATVQGFDRFESASSPNETLLFLQSFLGVWSVAALAVSIEVETRRAAEAQVRALNETLEQRVVVRTEELRRVRDRLEEAQRVANVGSWEWDVAADTIWWSDELFRIFGVPRMANRRYEDYLSLLHPDDRGLAESIVGKSLADGRPFSFEHRLVRSDGSMRTIQVEGHVVADVSGRPVRLVGTGRDVTDLRAAEDERLRRLREQAARMEAEDASRAKDEFLATLSHELRTPLNAALGWSQMLRDVLKDPTGRARASEAIMRNLQAQARLVSDMMDVSAIALRTLRLDTRPVSLHDVVRAAIESARGPSTAQRVRIEAVLAPTPVNMIGDPVRLQQVVWNLVSNAAKFCRDGGRVTVRVSRDGDVARLTVQDDGPGIDPAFLPYVFERFRQADSSATRTHGGLGLGLAIARHLVEAHGGTIEAANRAEGGAEFTVRFPAAPLEGGGDLAEAEARSARV